MSSPIRLNTNTVYFNSGVTFFCGGIGPDFRKAGIFAFRDNFADFVCGHIEDGSKFVGRAFGIFYDSRFCKDGLDFIACGKDSATRIKNCTALRLFDYLSLLLFSANVDIIVVFLKLQIYTPHHERQKRRYQKGKEENDNADVFQNLVVN